jgi:Transposase DDE domain group 1
MGRFETQWLATKVNLSSLTDLSGHWIDLVHSRMPPRGIVLDMDSSVSPTHGEQEMSVWNGHYQCTCYHPLFVFNQFGDLERCALRAGNVHSADGWEACSSRSSCGIAGSGASIFGPMPPSPCRASTSTWRLSTSNTRSGCRPTKSLQGRIGYLLKRPVGRPPNEVRRFHANFTYQAARWSKPRRVIAKVKTSFIPGSASS